MKTWIGMAGFMALAATAWAVDGVIEISQADMTSPPYIISQSGSYILTENLTVTNESVNGIEVRAYHVTLDLNGFMLKGPGAGHSSSNGIFQDVQYEDLTVKNGTILDWAGGSGIWAIGKNHVLQNLCLVHNQDGASLANQGLIQGCILSTNVMNGVLGANWYAGLTTMTISDCSACGNGAAGVYGASDGEWIIENCLASQNGQYGIALYAGTVKNSTASFNGQGGISIGQGLADQCIASYNTNVGISCGGTLRGCSATYNGGTGINGNGVIRDCFAGSNKGDGFSVYGEASGCSSSWNKGHGYYVEIRTHIHDCQADLNTEAGIYLRYSTMGTYATAEDNVMVDNGYGLLCDQATGNFIARNKAMNNTTNFYIGAGNSYAEILTPGAAFTNANPWANISD